VAVAVGSGRSNREAADELFISVKTVDHHLQRIYRKLGIKGRSSLAVLVTRDGAQDAVPTERGALDGSRRADAHAPTVARRPVDDHLVWMPSGAPGETDDDPWAAADVPVVALSDEQLDFLSAFAEQPPLPRIRGVGDPTAAFEAG
jgi:hypothetical protein